LFGDSQSGLACALGERHHHPGHSQKQISLQYAGIGAGYGFDPADFATWNEGSFLH
jgi:hypothetical protein